MVTGAERVTFEVQHWEGKHDIRTCKRLADKNRCMHHHWSNAVKRTRATVANVHGWIDISRRSNGDKYLDNASVWNEMPIAPVLSTVPSTVKQVLDRKYHPNCDNGLHFFKRPR